MDDQNTTVTQLKDLVAAFVAERDWRQFHDPKNLAASILIEAAELMEHFQWLRSDQLDAVRKDPGKVSEVREEVADVLAFLLSFANVMDIDLASALSDKMRKNALKYPADTFRGRFR
ncbi:MAG: nucleotide pyrophosphohydrolase [Phycisphaerae bacterium]|nr:MAG: nucleotide pyrophosphohydrolase [Planctomycetota bacterium]KAB2945826.1 MAG: nucleotide pyrophosphohydrolase [Phycisphaerae bacterium]MBE7457646.1 nucleotide pyrophosphohydrolase [Planctomycetia bacterium]MCK6463837.1 nucleotide pyrophosphohydrolase [Phycisphaerae bacterium]MCL4717448.1 nucleotide pyrophosphohydrolase [Phycisphaerae bacterium]